MLIKILLYTLAGLQNALWSNLPERVTVRFDIVITVHTELRNRDTRRTGSAYTMRVATHFISLIMPMDVLTLVLLSLEARSGYIFSM